MKVDAKEFALVYPVMVSVRVVVEQCHSSTQTRPHRKLTTTNRAVHSFACACITHRQASLHKQSMQNDENRSLIYNGFPCLIFSLNVTTFFSTFGSLLMRTHEQTLCFTARLFVNLLFVKVNIFTKYSPFLKSLKLLLNLQIFFLFNV